MTFEHQPAETTGLTKVTVKLEKSDRHNHATETMWALPLGDGRFKIQNVPFYAYDLSYDDVVEAINVGHLNVMRRVLERGGHSTYRIFVTSSAELKKFSDHWARLEQLGCSLERATERLFGIDVPPEANIFRAYELLQMGQDASVWDFEEAHVGHSL